MNVSGKVIGFTVVFSISLIATVKPEAFGFVRVVPYGDKFAHFILFGLLGMLSVLQARRYDPVYMWPGIMLTTGFAIADETLQLAFASRSFSLTDLLANLLGILVFSVATACYCQQQSRAAQCRRAVAGGVQASESGVCRIELEPEFKPGRRRRGWS